MRPPDIDGPADAVVTATGEPGEKIVENTLLPHKTGKLQRTPQAGFVAKSSLRYVGPPALVEKSDTYPRVIAALNDRWRVIRCADSIQWILQHRTGRTDGWRGRSFCQTRETLKRCIREHAGEIDSPALERVDALPPFITRGGKWLK